MNICRESTSEVELAVEQSISIHSATRTNLQIATNKQPCRVNVDREMALQTSYKGGVVGRDLNEIVASAVTEVEKARSTTTDLVSIESDILVVEKGTQEILSASEEIGAAIAQVKKGIEQISAAATEADKAATEAASAAKQQAKGAEDLAAAIEEISSLADELQSAA